MATITHALATANTANASNYVSGAFTPANNDILVAFVVASGTTIDTATLSSSVGGQTFSRIVTANKATNGDRLYAFISNSRATAVSQTVTFDCTGDAATGAVIEVIRIADIGKVGISTVRQYAIQSNQAGATTPAPTFSQAVLTTNLTIGFVGNSTSPATMTPPASWSEGNDTGYSTPTTGAQYIYRVSGFSGTVINWGNASSTEFGSIILEIDAGVSGTSNRTIGFSGSATGIFNKNITVSWLEVEFQPNASHGTSSGTINIIGSATGLNRISNISISWLEIEFGTIIINGTSNRTINIIGSATGIGGISRLGTSTETINLTGSAIGEGIYLIISWIKVDSNITSIGASNRTITLSGSATGIRTTLHGTSSKILPILGTASGTISYATIHGTSNRTVSLIGFATGINTFAGRTGTSTITITITGTTIGKVKVTGTSTNKIIATVVRGVIIFDPSLRIYKPVSKTRIFIASSRTKTYTSAVRNYLFRSAIRTYLYFSRVRNNRYNTPTRIGS